MPNVKVTKEANFATIVEVFRGPIRVVYYTNANSEICVTLDDVGGEEPLILFDTAHGDEIEVRRSAEAIFATHAGITLDAAIKQFNSKETS